MESVQSLRNALGESIKQGDDARIEELLQQFFKVTIDLIRRGVVNWDPTLENYGVVSTGEVKLLDIGGLVEAKAAISVDESEESYIGFIYSKMSQDIPPEIRTRYQQLLKQYGFWHGGAIMKTIKENMYQESGREVVWNLDLGLLQGNDAADAIPTSRDGGVAARKDDVNADYHVMKQAAEAALTIAAAIRDNHYDGIVMSGGSTLLPYELVQEAWKRFSSKPLKIYTLDRKQNVDWYQTGDIALRRRVHTELMTEIGNDIGVLPEHILYIDTHWDSGTKRGFIEENNVGSFAAHISFAVFAAPEIFSEATHDIVGGSESSYVTFMQAFAARVSRAIGNSSPVFTQDASVQAAEKLLTDSDRARLRLIKEMIRALKIDTGSEGKDGGKGGIDFRGIPVIAQPGLAPAGVNVQLQQLAVGSKMTDLAAAWRDIEAQMKASAMPYAKMREYIAVCKSRKDGPAQLQRVFACLMNIVRVEEENALEADRELKELLVCLG
jgi:hypothetical protein